MAQHNDQFIEHSERKFVHPGQSGQMLYANGFVGGQSPFDVYVIGIQNGNANFTINMSFTTAKALQMLMNKMMKEIEDAGIAVPTNEEIAQKLHNIKQKAENE
jgi:hypothetical protein